MADPVQYTGATYNAEMYKLPNETMSEYLARLAKLRAQGILGGGGMLDVKETPTTVTPAAQQPLGELVVRNTGGDSDSTPVTPATTEERYKGARYLLDNPVAAAVVRGLMPLGLGSLLMSDNQLEAFVRNTQNEATKSQGFLDYLLGNEGDVVTGDRGIGDGSLVTGQASGDITRDMFPEIFDPMNFTKQMGVVPSTQSATAYPAPMPQIPQIPQGMLSPSATSAIAESVALTGSGSGSSSDPYSAGWSAEDTSSWDTSGGGTNADGSYDISGWFSD